MTGLRPRYIRACEMEIWLKNLTECRVSVSGFTDCSRPVKIKLCIESDSRFDFQEESHEFHVTLDSTAAAR